MIDFDQAYTYLSQELIIEVLKAMNFPSLFMTALSLQFDKQTRVIIGY